MGLTEWVFLFFLCLCSSSINSKPTAKHHVTANDRPIIGILTMIVVDNDLKPFGETFIAASYVKYMESGGCRVVPIKLTLTDSEYEDIFNKINGLLLIGGAIDIETSEFARVAKIFYKLALEANNKGDYFPIWGTCLGMQLLTALVAGKDLLSITPAENDMMPLNLTQEAYTSNMFADFPSDMLTAVAKEPLTGNFHKYGMSVTTFQGNEDLRSFFSILSTNMAHNGVEFISTFEGKKHPFYGVQWHPEVSCYKWSRNKNVPHSPNAVRLTALLAGFFVNEGRRSLHRFNDIEEEEAALIYNYQPVFIGNISGYEQAYFFRNSP
ncbi:gamma-glutamyl hydrolase [Synchiropus picturatus]